MSIAAGVSRLAGGTVLLGRLKQSITITLLAVITVVSLGTLPVRAEEDHSGRKVKSRVQPTYPELARRMNLAGVVKVEVVIGANGQVKNAKVIGGHPVLVESAMDAVKRWRYEPSSEETTTTVEFKFAGNQ
jgi:TonB family protein